MLTSLLDTGNDPEGELLQAPGLWLCDPWCGMSVPVSV